MSAQPVDVLAVMDEAMRHAEERGNMNRSSNLREARAAVAELVAAVSAVYGGPCVDDEQAADDPCPPSCMSCRIRAALARVQGGVA